MIPQNHMTEKYAQHTIYNPLVFRFTSIFINGKCKQIIKNNLDDDTVHVQHKYNLPTNFQVTKKKILNFI